MTEIKSAALELGTERIRKLLVQYAVPAIIAMTASSLYNMVDSIFIGHGVGPLAISGLALTFPLMNLAAAFGSLVGVGAATLISMRLGQRDYETAQRVLGNVLVLNLIIGIAFGLAALLFLDPILYFFGASEATIGYAREYMTVILLGNVVTHMYLGLNSVLRASGHPRKSMYATINTVVINTILDPLFIFGFGWGIRGAAIATVLAQVISLVWQLRILSNKQELLHFRRGIWQLRKTIVTGILSIGMAPCLVNVCGSAVTVAINRQLADHGGDLAIGAYGIINRILILFAMLVIGLTQGMQPIIGYNYGAGDTARIRLAEKHILKTALLFCTIMFVFAQWDVSAGIFVGLFTQNAAYRSMTVHFIHIYTLSVIPLAVQYALVDGLTGMSLVGASLPLSFFRKGIYIALAVFLPIRFGAPAMFYAEPLSDVVAAVVTTIVFVTVVPGLLRKREALLGKHIEK